MLMPVLTPHGVLTLRRDEEAPELEPAQGAKLEQAFRRHGLLALALTRSRRRCRRCCPIGAISVLVM